MTSVSGCSRPASIMRVRYFCPWRSRTSAPSRSTQMLLATSTPPGAEDEVAYCCIELVGLLPVSPQTGVFEHLELRSGDHFGQAPRTGDGSIAARIAREDQNGHIDLRDLFFG